MAACSCPAPYSVVRQIGHGDVFFDRAQHDIPFQGQEVQARGVLPFADVVGHQRTLDAAQVVVTRCQGVQRAHDFAVGAGKVVLFHFGQQSFLQVHFAFSLRCICIKISSTRSSFLFCCSSRRSVFACSR